MKGVDLRYKDFVNSTDHENIKSKECKIIVSKCPLQRLEEDGSP
jgi:hypothetical protein